LKAKACVAGRRALYDWCEARKVPHRRLGKLVVASGAAEEMRLHALHDQGFANGVEGLRLLSGREAMALEPELSCTLALESAETGIIDAHAYALSLQGALEDLGGVVALGAEVERLEPKGDQWRVVSGGTEIFTDLVVNAAGLWAPDLAARIAGYPPAQLPTARYARGSYAALSGKAPFSRLVYPLPVEGGLGVHATLDLGGAMRFGPDVEWIEGPDYRVATDLAERFAPAIRPYWPGLDPQRLTPDYAGVRPKLEGPLANGDFVIEGEAAHGLRGLVSLFGIESPGLTASLALGDAAAGLLLDP
jgi:L-2-hydroxyglutarate oxidase LhgO